MFRVHVSGLKEVDARLGALGPALGSAAIAGALQVAAEPTVILAEQLAPYDSDRKKGKHLADTITASTKLKRSQRKFVSRGGVANVFIGPSAPHGHLIEFGYTLVISRGPRKGQVIKHIPAHAFLRPAWDLTKDEVLANFAAHVHQVIEATARGARVAAAAGTLDRKAAASLFAA